MAPRCVRRCLVLLAVAAALIAAFQEVKPKVPFVVRLEGTNVDLGKRMLADSGLNVATEPLRLVNVIVVPLSVPLTWAVPAVVALPAPCNLVGR